jgi:lysophospholipase L1-like esterase
MTRRALKVGNQQAKAVLEFRAEALRAREEALSRRAALLDGDTQPLATADLVPPALLSAVGGPQTAGVLVAEGDSWFNYPWTDVLRILEDQHGFDVESVANAGDRVEEMAYGGGQLEKFTRKLEKLLRRNVVPRAILLSGGGNDVAGDEFAGMLNHASSAAAGLNEAIVQGVIDQRIRLAYLTILQAVTALCQARIGRAIPILVHGYDYPVPDGRGFLGGFWVLPGPWLHPGFQAKGYREMNQRKRIAKDLIDRFNAMLQGVAALPEMSHVRYVDLRGTLSTGTDYRKWWDNELHPTRAGFRHVADRIAARI